MRFATLFRECEMKLASLTLLLEDDVIGRLERDRRRRLHRDVACLRTTVERQDLRAALDRCREDGADELRELLDRQFVAPRVDRRLRHPHLRNT